MAVGYAKLSNDFWRDDDMQDRLDEDPRALCMFFNALSYASDNLTDGWLSHRALRRLGIDGSIAGTLERWGLFEHVDGHDDGWQIASYTAEQTPAERVREQARLHAERQKRYRERKARGASRDDNVTRPNQNQNQNQNQINSSDEELIIPPKPSLAFDQFWSVYPNHDYPDDALRTFNAIMHRPSERPQLAALIGGAQSLAANVEPRFWPSASKWLRGGGWKNPVRPHSARPSKAQSNAEYNARFIAEMAKEDEC